ncbi:hypothetical protein [Streptosporangium sp. NPDC023615]|uniref:hypothetical protein n=1 Tax=Streptosporangium sp. NPDC023615 TaxID=3154794 RepID=UPI003434D5FB
MRGVPVIIDDASADYFPLNVQTAVTRLREARQLQLALEPVRHLLADVDEQLREALADGERAGLAQRVLAAQSGVSQPTVKAMLDGRRGPVTPLPALGEHIWSLHQSAAALDTLTRRLLGQDLARQAPNGRHADPFSAVKTAAEALDKAAKALASAAAAQQTWDRDHLA